MIGVAAGRFRFEPDRVGFGDGDDGVIGRIRVLECRAGQAVPAGDLWLTHGAWRELSEMLRAPVLRPAYGPSAERLTVPLVEHLRRKRP